jgi:hypothetical protein
MNDIGRFIPGIVLALAVLLVLGRHHLMAGERSWWVLAVLDGPSVAGLSGGLLAWAAPQWVAVPVSQLLQPAFLFLGGWVGFQVGCGLDLRAVQRAAVVPFLFEGATALATTAIVLVMAYTASRLVPGVPTLVPEALLVLAGVFCAGPALPGSGQTLSRWAGRGGFWNPSAAAALAVLLAATGSALAPWPVLHVAIPGWEGTTPVEIDSLAGRLLWVIVVGCVAGLVADLATKDEFVPGRLYLQLAAVILVAAGVAGAIGLETLLVTAVAGFWLVNATLRRLDILHVLQRGATLPHLLAPLLGGWLVGGGARDAGIDPGTFGLVLILALLLRPVARIAGRRMVAGLVVTRGRRKESLPAGLVEIDALGILLATVLTRILEPAAGSGAMAAVLAAQWLLRIGSCAWDQHEAGKQPDSVRAQ